MFRPPTCGEPRWLPEMAVVMQVANFFGPQSGGLKTTLMSLARSLETFGHDVYTVVPGDCTRTSRSDRHTVCEIQASRVPGLAGYRVITNRQILRHILDTVRPDALCISDRTTLLWAAHWAQATGTPVSFIAHERVDGVLRTFLPWLPARRLADLWNRRLAKIGPAIICTTSFAAEEFARIGAPVLRVPLGVDLDEFNPSLRSEDLRDSFSTRTLVGLVCRLSREKRPDFAIEVMKELAGTRPDIHLVVAGDGPLRRRLERQAAELPVSFLGYIADRGQLARLLASLDVILAPGPIETFGLAALESMASGTPVVANARSGVAEVVGLFGGRVIPLHAPAWADAVMHLAGGPEASHRRARARLRAEEFSWDVTVRRLLAIHHIHDELDPAA